MFLVFFCPLSTFAHFDSQLRLTLTFAPRLFILLPHISVYLLSDSCQLFTCLPHAPTDQSSEKVIGHARGIGNQELRLFSHFSYGPSVRAVSVSPKLLFQTTPIFCLSPVRRGFALPKGLSAARGQRIGRRTMRLSHSIYLTKENTFISTK